MTALLNAEVRKVLGLRYWWILGIAPVVVGLFTGALTLPLARQVEDIVGEGFASTVSAAIGIALALALVFLFAAVFGAVCVRLRLLPCGLQSHAWDRESVQQLEFCLVRLCNRRNVQCHRYDMRTHAAPIRFDLDDRQLERVR